MNTMVIYMMKVTVYTVTFFLIYTLLLKKDTALSRNRAFILLSLATALVLPLFTFETIKPPIQFFGKLLAEDLKISPVPGTHSPNPRQSGILQFSYSIYITGTIIFLCKLLIDFSNLLFLILLRKKEGSRIIRFQNFSTAGFSAMGYIFINTRLSPEEAGNIINHEKKHLSQNHYIDIIFMEFLIAFQWFNPFIHLFNRELRAIHEFQADRDCLSSGIPVVNYQSLILSQVFRSGVRLTNSFSNPSLIRKRMMMMTRKPSSHLSSLKLLLLIPVTGVLFLSLSANPIPLPPPPPPPPEKEVPFVVVEQMPLFPGGDGALLRFITENIVYPEDAKAENIQGRVIVRFCVTAAGGISQVSVIKGVSPDLDEEAIRVVKNLPSFTPGKQGGIPVPVWYMVPITYSLK